MKYLPGLLFAFFLVPEGSAQISEANQAKIHLAEDSLFLLGDNIVNGRDEFTRQMACYAFIPALVKALKVKGSFYYPFDSLKTISIINSPDNKFRIFTWQLTRDNGTFRYFGAIQLKSKKELKLFPLFDNSAFLKNVQDTVMDGDNWFGCLYYNVIKSGKYYTLFGWDGHHLTGNIKLIDILTVKKNRIEFGKPVFHYGTDTTYHRVLVQYNERAMIGLNYDVYRKMIIYDHLVPEAGNILDRNTYIPDGTYEGFVFKKKAWHHVGKVFHFDINQPNNPPVPVPKPNKSLDY